MIKQIDFPLMRSGISGFLSLAALVFFVFYFVFPGYYKLYAYVISIFGVMIFVSKRERVDYRPFFTMLSVFLMMSLSDLYNLERGFVEISDLERIMRNSILVFPFLFFLLRSPIRPINIALAGVTLFVVTFVFVLLQKIGVYAQEASHFNGVNPGLWFNKGSFSSAIVIFFALFSGIFIYLESFQSRFLFFISCFFIGVILYFTQARGPFLAFLFVVFSFVFFTSGKKPIIKILSLAFLCFFVFLFLYYAVLGDSFLKAYQEFLDHFEKGSEYTSVSIRLDTWGLAWDVFIQSPIWGSGTVGADVIKESIIETGKYPGYIKNYHAHSEFFLTLERGGLVGLFGLAWLLFFPFLHLRYMGLSFNKMIPLFMVVCSFIIIGVTSATIRNNIGANTFMFCLLFAYFFSYKYFIRESI